MSKKSHNPSSAEPVVETSTPVVELTPAGVDEEISQLVHDIDGLRAAFDEQVRIIADCQRRTARAKQDFDAAVLDVDARAEEAARSTIRTCKVKRGQADEKLTALRPQLANLAERREQLRLKAITLTEQAQPRFEQARKEVFAAQTRNDYLGRVAATVRDLQWDLDKQVPPAVEPEPSPGPEPDEPMVAGKPRCPLCGIAQASRQVAPGRWTCGRAHHPHITFDDNGKVLSKGEPLPLSLPTAGRTIRTKYDVTEPPAVIYPS